MAGATQTPDDLSQYEVKPQAAPDDLSQYEVKPQAAAPAPQSSIGPPETPSMGNNFQGSDRVSKYLDEAENLTQEGKKAHPIESVTGDVSRPIRAFQNRVGATMQAHPYLTMGATLLAGKGMGEGEMPIPKPTNEVPPGGFQPEAPGLVQKVATAPIRYGARTLEGAINSKLSPVRAASGVMNPVGEGGVVPPIRVWLRNFGLGMDRFGNVPTPMTLPDSAFEGGDVGIPHQMDRIPGREAPLPEPLTQRQLGPAMSIQTPPPRMSMLESQGGTLPQEPRTTPFKMTPPDETPKMGVQNPAGKPTPFEETAAPNAKEAGKRVAQVTKQAAGEPAPKQGPKTEAQTSLEEKYPDKQDRSDVHNVGSRAFDMIGDDDATLQALKKTDARRLRDAYESNGIKTEPGVYSGSKYRWSYTGKGREADINYLLDKGLKPADIVNSGKK